MNIQVYEKKIAQWDVYPSSVKPTIYLLGAYGELGELVENILEYYEKYKKIEQRQMKLALEIGDVYWYLFRFMSALGFTYKEIKSIQTSHKFGIMKFSVDPLITLLKIYSKFGKITNDFKKIFRDHGGVLEKKQMDYGERIAKIFKYMDHFLQQIGFTFEEIIEMNYEKLDSRFKRGKIKGIGDKR